MVQDYYFCLDYLTFASGIGRMSLNVGRNYQSMLLKIPEERRSYSHRVRIPRSASYSEFHALNVSDENSPSGLVVQYNAGCV